MARTKILSEFSISGFPPERLARAKERRDLAISKKAALRDEALSQGRRLPRLPSQFSANGYMESHRATPYCRTFASRQAAIDVAELLRKNGWLNVSIQAPESAT